MIAAEGKGDDVQIACGHTPAPSRNKDRWHLSSPSTVSEWAKLSHVFHTDVVVDSVAQLLLTAKVTFRGLDSSVPKQELDLLQFAASQVA